LESHTPTTNRNSDILQVALENKNSAIAKEYEIHCKTLKLEAWQKTHIIPGNIFAWEHKKCKHYLRLAAKVALQTTYFNKIYDSMQKSTAQAENLLLLSIKKPVAKSSRIRFKKGICTFFLGLGYLFLRYLKC